MTKDEITAALDEAGIEHDKRWSVERLSALLPSQGTTIAVVVMRDFWDEHGERHRAGTVINVSIEDALDGVESGAFSRYRG